MKSLPIAAGYEIVELTVDARCLLGKWCWGLLLEV
jgi:hypothetical protein